MHSAFVPYWFLFKPKIKAKQNSKIKILSLFYTKASQREVPKHISQIRLNVFLPL